MERMEICNNHIYIENINCYDTERRGNGNFPSQAFVQMFVAFPRSDSVVQLGKGVNSPMPDLGQSWYYMAHSRDQF